jgi:cytochrome c
MPLALAVGILALAAAPAASAAGDAAAGQALAQRWCTGCHVIDRSGHGPDIAPPFPAIAHRHHNDEHWLRAWLAEPHPPMPNLNLSRAEIDDLVAYLQSFAAQ